MSRTAPDWLLYALSVVLMGVGILNLYSIEAFPSFAWSYAYTRQLLWALAALLVMGISTLVEGQTWRFFAYVIYGGGLFVMVLTALVAREVNGARAWLDIGPLRVQPSEFMKVATAMALATFVTRYSFRWDSWKDRLGIVALVGLPVGLTLLQRDTGTALTYGALLVPLYRWGLSAWVIGLPFILGGLAFLTLVYPWVYVGAVVSGLVLLMYLFIFRRKQAGLHVGILVLVWGWLALSGFLYERVLAPHQRQRIQALLNPYQDPLGAGWNTIQARIAVVAGGFAGQGYGKGLQSKLDFIPQRHTDFAFCGIAEEWGWLGSAVLLLLFLSFILRVSWVAERSNSPFALVYGYGFAGFLWIHFVINIAMVTGIFPVVGIPLIFISYGGSSWVAVGWGLGVLQSLYRERGLRLFG
ncbi:MAG: rod shape-determining protein RodA [Bacteroidia bacterium]|nr:rod shape-determining protein RodA [Bacteroidia bacterium]